MTALFEMRNVTKAYRGIPAVKSVHFELQEREARVFLGHDQPVRPAERRGRRHEQKPDLAEGEGDQGEVVASQAIAERQVTDAMATASRMPIGAPIQGEIPCAAYR